MLRVVCSSGAAGIYTPAELTWRRAALVNNTQLGRAAAAATLQHQLQSRSRQLSKAVKRFLRGAEACGEATAAAAGSGLGARQAVVAAVAAVTALGPAAVSVQWSEECAAIWQQIWAEPRGRAVSSSADEQAAAEGDGVFGADRPVARPPKVLADLIESIVGAVFVDSAHGRSCEGGTVGASSMSWENTWRVAKHLLPLLQ